MRYLIFLLVSLLATGNTYGQESGYPQAYFRNPLDIPMALAGGFGECRPNHFHTGIDLKTDQRENLIVRAAQEGYVSRVSISHTGYGNALYVTHPNGYTTVYGHLNDFFPALQEWVVEQQYHQQSWAVELFPEPGQFPLKKDELLAYSGNTGGSTGPHLHFEIRNTETGETLNPLLFGFKLSDTKAPKVSKLAFYNADQSIYQQNPHLSDYKAGKIYTLDYPLLGLGVEAKDYTNNSHNWLGIYEMKLYKDDQLQFATRLSEIDLRQNRYMNAYADFKTKEKTGKWYQLLYRLPGNQLEVYPFQNKQQGILSLDSAKVHAIRIELSDPQGNVTRLRFQVQYKGDVAAIRSGCPDAPDVQPNQAKFISNADFQLQLPENAVYDQICFRHSISPPPPKALSKAVRLLTAEVPLHTFSNLKIKLAGPVPFALRQKLAFVHIIRAADLPGNHPQAGMAAAYNNGWATAPIRTFGDYYVTVDTIPPRIKPLQSLEGKLGEIKRIRFRVEEETTSLTRFSGNLNGEWILFSRRGNTFSYEIDEHCPRGQHQLTVEAVDENNNRRELHYSFSR